MALITAILFPELMAMLFVLLFVAYRFAGNTGALDEHGFFWYPAMLAVPLTVVLANGKTRDAIGHALSRVDGAAAPLWALAGSGLRSSYWWAAAAIVLVVFAIGLTLALGTVRNRFDELSLLSFSGSGGLIVLLLGVALGAGE